MLTAKVEIKGKEYILTAITVGGIVNAVSFMKSRKIKLIMDTVKDKDLCNKLIADEVGKSYTEEEKSGWAATIEGAAYYLSESLKVHNPEVTFEWVLENMSFEEMLDCSNIMSLLTKNDENATKKK